MKASRTKKTLEPPTKHPYQLILSLSRCLLTPRKVSVPTHNKTDPCFKTDPSHSYLSLIAISRSFRYVVGSFPGWTRLKWSDLSEGDQEGERGIDTHSQIWEITISTPLRLTFSPLLYPSFSQPTNPTLSWIPWCHIKDPEFYFPSRIPSHSLLFTSYVKPLIRSFTTIKEIDLPWTSKAWF